MIGAKNVLGRKSWRRVPNTQRNNNCNERAPRAISGPKRRACRGQDRAAKRRTTKHGHQHDTYYAGKPAQRGRSPPAEACPLVHRQPPISLRCVSPKSLPSFRKSRKKNSHYCAVQPPSTGMVVPVTLWATRSQSQSASAPISSGSEVRNEGCFSPNSSAIPASRLPPCCAALA